MKCGAHSNCEGFPDIPKHWGIKRGRFVMQVNPTAPRLRDLKPADEVSFVPMDAVGVRGGICLEQTRILSEISSGYTEFQDGDVIIAKITPCFENGKAALAAGLLNGCAYGTTELHVLRAKSTLHNRFLFYAVTSNAFLKLGEAEMYGAGGQKRVPQEFVKNFQVAVPPFSEQQLIASFLDRETSRIDQLIKKKQDFIERLKEKRTALISRAVTRGLDLGVKLKPSGVEWLDAIPEHWDICKIAHGFDSIGSGTTPPSEQQDWYDGNIPWITTGELRENIIFDTSKKVSPEAVKEFSALKIHPAGALAIAMYGATIGRLGILGVAATTNQACCVLSNGRAFAVKFVFYWLQAFKETVILLASGGGQPNISQEKIRSLKIACPSIDEQQSIARHLDEKTLTIDRLITNVEIAIERLREYRAALITEVVTGQIDVRKAVS